MKRMVEPEWLDALPPGDPMAVGSRRDLCRVNAWMENAAIVAGAVRESFPEAPRRIIEIGAGDGTLARFLSHAGVNIRAVDDQSWAHVIRYPEEVEKMDAAEALARYQPKAVVCSFPPPKNSFEQKVFATPSVDLYLVLTTRHRFAAGDWSAYESQTEFALQTDESLARMLLPPEIDPQVLVFERKSVG